MARQGLRAGLAGILVVAAIVAPSALGAKPVLERIDVDESFADDFLTEECGVPVTTSAQGHIIARTFEGEGTGAASVRTINVGLTATAGGNTYRFRDVGADVVRIEPDGTAILLITGQVPFDFAGLLMIDLETGEAILEPQHSLGENLEKACAVLSA